MKTAEVLDSIKDADIFLDFLKSKKITSTALKSMVFGKTACKVIKAIKKDKQPVFDQIIQSHQVWWSTKHAIEQYLEVNP